MTHVTIFGYINTITRYSLNSNAFLIFDHRFINVLSIILFLIEYNSKSSFYFYFKKFKLLNYKKETLRI